MTKFEAHQILDQQKSGLYVAPYKINQALIVTGDLGTHEELRSDRVARQIQEQSLRAWGEPCESLVG